MMIQEMKRQRFVCVLVVRIRCARHFLFVESDVLNVDLRECFFFAKVLLCGHHGSHRVRVCDRERERRRTTKICAGLGGGRGEDRL